jgi:hypothetical protein
MPLVHIVLLVPVALGLVVGDTLTLGSWGALDVRLAALYLLPALLLHAWASAARRGLAPRLGAWAIVAAMCVHTGVLLQPPVLAAVALGALLDAALHRAEAAAPRRERASPGARMAAGLIGLLAVLALALLARFATPDAALRLGLAALLAAALAVAAVLSPGLRAPARLLPALGLYYLAFALGAAPVLPFGPALAWWLLCGSLCAGAALAARHVRGPDLPPAARRHEHVVQALPDPLLAADVAAVQRYLASGDGAQPLAERVARASGEPAMQQRVLRLAHGSQAERERALREALGLTD